METGNWKDEIILLPTGQLEPYAPFIGKLGESDFRGYTLSNSGGKAVAPWFDLIHEGDKIFYDLDKIQGLLPAVRLFYKLWDGSQRSKEKNYCTVVDFKLHHAHVLFDVLLKGDVGHPDAAAFKFVLAKALAELLEET